MLPTRPNGDGMMHLFVLVLIAPRACQAALIHGHCPPQHGVHGLLDRRTPNDIWWRLLGWYTIVAAALALYSTLHRPWLSLGRTEWLRLAFFALYSAYAIVQVLEQVGQPVLIWRPPLLGLMATLSVAIVVNRGDIGWRWRVSRNDGATRADQP